MLGSHNSCTSYKHPWLQTFYNIFSKCQSKSLPEQAKSGVRFFDIRVRMENNGQYTISHGLVDYEIGELGLHFILGVLKTYTTKTSPIYFRILLEYNIEPDQSMLIIQKFQKLVNEACKGLVDDSFRCTDIRCKWNWASIEVDFPLTNIPQVHIYSSVQPGWKKCLWCIPWLYAIIHNRWIKKKYKDVIEDENRILVLDFV